MSPRNIFSIVFRLISFLNGMIEPVLVPTRRNPPGKAWISKTLLIARVVLELSITL